MSPTCLYADFNQRMISVFGGMKTLQYRYLRKGAFAAFIHYSSLY